ncbi:hypothetical protein ACLK12_20685 [Escherichia coli]
MARNTSCIAGASPMISGVAVASCWRDFALGALLLEVIFGAAHQGHRLVDVERLGQVLEGTALVGVDRAVEESEWAVMMMMGRSA